MEANWFLNILRMLFTFLDRLVYALITYLYQLFLYLTNLDIFKMSTLTNNSTAGDNVILNFASRIYALLGIFMLFRVSFSILQYMVNPDDFSDKGKGFGKMVTNILVSLVLIVTVPYIFQTAFEVQKVVLESNLSGKLILADSTSIDSTSTKEMAEDLEFLVYGSFFSVDTSVISSCSDGPVLGTKAMATAGDGQCLKDLADAFKDVGGANKLGDFFMADGGGRRFDAFGEVVNIRKDGKYVFNYMYIVSTIAGGFVAIMMLSFCIDMAVRMIKLGFLEIISPIPIISYMDPKQSGRDGMLGKWAHECLITFLSLFIRIAIIYFVFFVIDLVANEVLVNPDDQYYLTGGAPTDPLMSVLVRVMVILGVFFFAKEVPKLLENLIPGMSGAGSLNFDKLKTTAFGASVAGATVGGALGTGISNIAANVSKNRELKNKWKNGEISEEEYKKQRSGFLQTAGSAIAGATSGGIRSGSSAYSSKKMIGGMLSGIDTATQARNNRRVRTERGYTTKDRILDAGRRIANIKSKTGGVGAMEDEINVWTRLRENEQVREQTARDAQRQLLSNTKHNMSDMEHAMFNPLLDEKGHPMVDPVTGASLLDKNPNSIRSYDDYLKDGWDGMSSTLIDKDLYEAYASKEKEALQADQNAEAYRKSIDENQKMVDINKK